MNGLKLGVVTNQQSTGMLHKEPESGQLSRATAVNSESPFAHAHGPQQVFLMS